MPDEPKQSMDGFLKSFAQKRREQAGPPQPMPPQMRQTLQSELDRRFGREPRASSPGWLWLAAMWPRLAFGASLAAGVLLAGLIWFLPRAQEGQNLELAKLDASQNKPAGSVEGPLEDRLQDLEQTLARPSGPAPEREALTAANLETENDPAPEQAELLTRLEKNLAPSDGVILRVAPELTPEPAALARNTESAPEPKADAAKLALRTTAAPMTAPAPPQSLAQPAAPEAAPSKAPAIVPTSAAPIAAATYALSENAAASQPVLSDTNSIRLMFVQSDWRTRYRSNYNSPPFPDILNRFEVQTAGNTLQIIDADGSVYSGTIEPPQPELARVESRSAGLESATVESVEAASRASASRSLALPPAPERAQNPADAYYFEARGNNNSLNQLLVITGHLHTAASPEVTSSLDDKADASPALGAAASPDAEGSRSERFAVTQQNRRSVTGASAVRSYRFNPGLTNSIRGSATVGGTNQFKIEAVSLSQPKGQD